MFYVYTITFSFNKVTYQKIHTLVISLINKSIYPIKTSKKNIILLLCVCFPFFSLVSQSQVVDLPLCSEEEKVKFYDDEGNLSSKGCVVNGKYEGVWMSYFSNGNKSSEGEFKESKLIGPWVFYHDNSQIRKEINYQDDLKNGVEKNYSENGILINQTNWILDKKEGEELRCFESGQIQHVTFFSNNKKHGKCRQYAKDGRIIAFKKYKEGVIFSTEKFNRFNKQGNKTGVWKEFYENLIISEEGPWVDGLKHGIFRSYDKRGDLINLVKYEFGKIIEDEEILDPIEVIRLYHPNGQCSEETVYKNGIKHGVFREFNTSGKITDGGYFDQGVLEAKGITDKEGRRQGRWLLYYKSGEIKAEGNYLDGLREGEWIFYYESGEVEQRGFYEKGEYDGEWVWSFKNGDKKRFEQYIKGVEYGDFIEYDSIGNILLKGNYRNGLREGEWIYHVNDHKEEGFYISGKKNGEWIHSFNDGTVIFRGSFSFGEPTGLHKVWSAKGTLISSGRFREGVKHGKWYLYKPNGELEHSYKYRNGVLIKVDGSKVKKSD